MNKSLLFDSDPRAIFKNFFKIKAHTEEFISILFEVICRKNAKQYTADFQTTKKKKKITEQLFIRQTRKKASKYSKWVTLQFP